MTSFSQLTCGLPSADDPLSTILANISKSIDAYYSKLLGYIKTPDENALLFGPFCARALLEISLTAIIGRIDPFRLLIIRGYQSNAGFDISRKNNAAIQWSRDIIPEQARDGKDPSKLWNQSANIENISRALFAHHIDTIYWEPAFDAFIDSLGDNQELEVVSRLKIVDSKYFIPKIKGMAMQLYPALSKGVHAEFVIPMESQFDAATLTSSISNTIDTIVDISTVSHFIKPSYNSVSQQQLIEILKSVQENTQ